jgi:predicted DNA-binding mobile mystery protein A
MATSASKNQSFQARVAIDSRLGQMSEAAKLLSRPQGGWVQAIRLALGMPVAVLAKRLGVSPSTIVRLEASEIAGRVNLNSLQKVANELNCELVYALVPREKLEAVVQLKAREVAEKQLQNTQKTMSLENQSIDEAILDRLIEQRAMELVNSSRQWKE